VRYWLHNNMVTVDGQKMGKSLGNFITLKQLFAGTHPSLSRAYSPLAIRQLILNSNYRMTIDFSDAALSAAQSGYDRITEAVTAIRKAIQKAPEGLADAAVEKELAAMKAKFQEAMNDDLNTAVALSVIFELVKFSNKLIADGKTSAGGLKTLDAMFTLLGGDVLGIVKDNYPQASGDDEKLLDHLIGLMIEQRKEARKKKDFAASDAIRDKLAGFGIALEDKPGGTTWRRG